MTLLIRDVPQTERPRERFIREGAKALSNQEIVAILLRTGTKQSSALHVASTLLSQFPTLAMFSEAPLEEIQKYQVLGWLKQLNCLLRLN